MHNPVWPRPSRGLAKPDGCHLTVLLNQHLNKLSDKDATSVGLLKKMNTLHFFSALYVLKYVLPIVSALSVAFQRG